MRTWKRLALSAVCLAMTACASVMKEGVEKDIEESRSGPEQAPRRNITNFATGLRCMDNLMIRYDVRDVVVLVEDLEDNTGKVNAGTKDMLISAVSDMTKRSRAIRLIAFGNDSGNLVAFVTAAGKNNIYSAVPQYDIRGSISQLDNNVARRQADAGLAVDDDFGIGISGSAAGSILGIDLSIIRTEDLSLVPGVASRNSVVIFKTGDAVDGDASIKKSGINFSIFFGKDEGQTQALRNLVELAAIELFGKLLKLPYWQCLGIDPEHPDVVNELQDWYYAMSVHQEYVPYVQKQLRNRGFYRGPLDGQRNPEFRRAVLDYRSALAMESEGGADLAFFKALLNRETPERASASAPAGTTSQVYAAAPQVETLSLSVTTQDGRSVYRPGEPVALEVDASADGYLYCFLQDGAGRVQRFFPNRFQPDGYVSGSQAVRIPGGAPYSITANEQGRTELVFCYLSKQEPRTRLPGEVMNLDFTDLPVSGKSELERLFQNATGGELAIAEFQISVMGN